MRNTCPSDVTLTYLPYVSLFHFLKTTTISVPAAVVVVVTVDIDSAVCWWCTWCVFRALTRRECGCNHLVVMEIYARGSIRIKVVDTKRKHQNTKTSLSLGFSLWEVLEITFVF